MSDTNRVWRLRQRPVGEISAQTLSLEREPVPKPGPGQFLFRANYLSLDPTNRIWMSDMEQYMPPVALGEPMRGVICGTVVESHAPGFAAGDLVSGIGAWADFQLGVPGAYHKLLAPPGLPVPVAFGLFAVVGPTAYFGLLEIGRPKAGETVVVSAAAGAVGSLVGQIAKIKGCRVVGLAGTDAKCSWLTGELGFDAAVNYHGTELHGALKRACPNGIDVYFDNVGGVILDTCLQHMNLNGRIPTCGLIAQYNATDEVAGPKHYPLILMRRLTVQGFIILDYAARFTEAAHALGAWLQEGRLKFRLDLREGLENAPSALALLFSGGNNGKLMLRIG
jgi:NADPH-dependent curcumin reductase